MPKKIITGLIILVILIWGVIGIYFLFIKKTPTVTKEPSSQAIFPSEQNKAGGVSSGGGEGETMPASGEEVEVKKQKFFVVSQNETGADIPIVGGISFIKKTTTTTTSITNKITATTTTATVARYIERGTGYIYENNLETLKPLRLSATIIPKISEALWMKDGKSLLIRYLKDDSETIETYYAKLKMSTTTDEKTEKVVEKADIDGVFLPTDIKEIVIGSNVGASVSPNKIFYLKTNFGKTTGTISNPDGSSKSDVFQSDISEWLPQWPKDKIITLITKPSADSNSFLYFFDPKINKFEKILGDMHGFTALTNYDGNLVLYSSSADYFLLKYYNIKTNTSSKLSVSTFPEKCAWSKKEVNVVYCFVPKYLSSGDMPDLWYQGRVSFDDNIWKINIIKGSADLIFSPEKETAISFDGINPMLSEKEDFLFFTSKKDFIMYGVRLLD